MQYRLAKFRFVLFQRLTGARFRSDPQEIKSLSDLTGQTLLDRYVVRGAVAHGGFSTIYEARDLVTGEKVAIKQLHAAPGRLRERFAKEVATLRSVRHPNIAPVLDSWIDPAGEACLAMPFLEGPTLRAELRSGPLDLPHAAQIVRGIGSALSEMHARGIVHRDLKPENVILTNRSAAEYVPVLIDFGIATLRDGRDHLSATLNMAGSLRYMAPECLTGHYSTATDVYSFSVMTLEMLTLKRLGDFEAGIHDPGFTAELRQALRNVAGDGRAASLATVLTQAYDPSPVNRPNAELWSERVASLLETAGGR